MESKYGSRRKTSPTRSILLGALAAFILGALLAGYVVWYNMDASREQLAASFPEATASPDADPTLATGPSGLPSAPLSPSPSPLAEALESEDAERAVEAVTRVAEQQGGIDQRLAAAEQRLTRLDLQAQAAAGNAARAEALLIAFATRRLIERGDELGYLADQLRLRFGDERPNAVNTIINFSRRDQPIRLDTLIARLDGLAPQLRNNEEGPSWERFSRELSQLFVIRRESTPSPQPTRRLERARWALEQGRIDSAIEEVKNMPGAASAEAWIEDAQRYRDVMIALENIERAAVLDQRGLRDREGNPVNQRSPADPGSDD
ncbi:hypothetical protein Ga0102493_111952 [Erythrobacter litoralis]|uniref:Uncharacterized protein n=1 Tax=Erythrobacter litoralis TaxID=39960 RepID=A0A074MI70_9SPHN|nr:hypothetical protein [Erythrobacter litoralis]AOL22972.1 hypothetical protein Ga0102493_111952 [Erythrobacter litoralis]KEO93159.1 hypothetical protein EH32_13115 [Erythrobacter litoralis]